MNTLLRAALVTALLGALMISYGCVRTRSHGYAQATIVESEPQPVYGYFQSGSPHYYRPPVYYAEPRPYHPVVVVQPQRPPEYRPPVYRQPEPRYPDPRYHDPRNQVPTPRLQPQPPRPQPPVGPTPVHPRPATPAPHGPNHADHRFPQGQNNHDRGN